MLTQLGKKLRILRIKYDELLKDMAKKLNITPAYLSSIENGKRLPSEKFIKQITDVYKLDGEVLEELYTAYFNTINETKISIDKAQKELGLVYARKFNSLYRSESDDNK